MTEHADNGLIAKHYCGQAQPHAAHSWTTPPIYGTATITNYYQCAGLSAPRGRLRAKTGAPS